MRSEDTSMPTSTIYPNLNQDEFKAKGYYTDNVGFSLEGDHWVNWVLSVTLLLVLTLELVWSNQPFAADKSNSLEPVSQASATEK